MALTLKVEAKCRPWSKQIADYLAALVGIPALSILQPTKHAKRGSMIWKI
jgi:hypothetical protein